MSELLRQALLALARLLFRLKIKGDPAVRAERLLIVANHESLLDGLLLGLILPQRPVFVVHTTVQRHFWFRQVLRLVDYLAVDPTSPMAMKSVIRLLESGRPVVIFPEGRITLTGSLMKTYDGPAFVAARSGATILPIHIDGAARTYFSRLSGRAPRRLLPRITLSVHPVTHIAMPDAARARDRRRKAGEAMRQLMQQMIFASRPQQTLYAAFKDAAAIYGRQRHVVEDLQQQQFSYADLDKAALLLGRSLLSHSRDGERIGLLLPNPMPTLALIFGLTAWRRVVAMLNYTAGSDSLQAACQAAEIKLLISSRRFVEQARLADKITSLHGVAIVYLEDLRASLGLKDLLWYWLWARPLGRLALPGSSPEDAAVVLFTSGSEGKPKGVVLPHRALLANIGQIRAVVDFSVDDKVLNALPLFHSFGLTAGSLLPLLSGASVFLYPSPLHYRVIPELAYDRSCTVLLGTSTFLANYARFAHPYDFYRLRYVIAGAEKLAEGVRNLWFEKFGIRIFEGYGATETAPVLAVNTPMAYRTGTVGQLLPGLEMQLLPVAGIGEGGQLHVRGPNLMAGYLRADNPGVLEPPASSCGEGWYDTGDIVVCDDDGFLRICGRVKRFAKVAGEMVSLEVVEQIANQTAADGQHAATCINDSNRGESIVLYSTVALSREALLASAKKLGSSELAVPRQLVQVAALPLLGSGKTDYVSLRQWAERDASKPT